MDDDDEYKQTKNFKLEKEIREKERERNEMRERKVLNSFFFII